MAGIRAPGYLVQFGREAMACRFAVYLNAGQYPQGPDAALRGLDLIEELESQLTVFRDTSEVAQINRTAASEPSTVESRLYDLLTLCLRLFDETHGAFDITAGTLVKSWGFYRRQGSIPRPDELRSAMELVGSRHLILEDARRSIAFARQGVELNLGSIGKGYALDRCRELMQECGVRDFLWHGGQSSVLATGSGADQASAERGWRVGVADPLHPERRLAEIWLRDQALGTSGASVQFFRHKGKRYGHILDPRTGWPAEGVFSATVIAPTAAEADALATAFYVLGVDGTAEYCQTHPQVAALLTVPSRSGSAVELVPLGFNPGQWRRLSAE